MLDKIEILNIAEDKEFDGGEIFGKISNQLNNFAFAVHEPLRQRYPNVFEMTEEEYKEVQESVEEFVASDEARHIKEEFEANALATIATESIKGLFKLMENDDKYVKKFLNNFLEKELNGYGK